MAIIEKIPPQKIVWINIFSLLLIRRCIVITKTWGLLTTFLPIFGHYPLLILCVQFAMGWIAARTFFNGKSMKIVTWYILRWCFTYVKIFHKVSLRLNRNLHAKIYTFVTEYVHIWILCHLTLQMKCVWEKSGTAGERCLCQRGSSIVTLLLIMLDLVKKYYCDKSP